jgi:hypothetical protein
MGEILPFIDGLGNLSPNLILSSFFMGLKDEEREEEETSFQQTRF